MEKRTYFISEVSRMVGVEPHVLRYWEDELDLEIGRNSQGKRCYTRQDVEYFQKVRCWKDKGMQLRAVKELLESEENPERLWTEQGRDEENVGNLDEEAAISADICQERHGKKTEGGEREQNGRTYSERDDKNVTGLNEDEEDTQKGCGKGVAKHKDMTDSCDARAEQENEKKALEYEIVEAARPQDAVNRFEQMLDDVITKALERDHEKMVREICDTILMELDLRLEKQMKERVREVLEPELMREMVRRGEEEAAAAPEKPARNRRKWRQFLKKLLGI